MTDSKVAAVEEKKKSEAKSPADFFAQSAEFLVAPKEISCTDLLGLEGNPGNFRGFTKRNRRDYQEDRFVFDRIDPAIIALLTPEEIAAILKAQAVIADRFIVDTEFGGSTLVASVYLPDHTTNTIKVVTVSLADSISYAIEQPDEKSQPKITQLNTDIDHPGPDSIDPEFHDNATPLLVFNPEGVWRIYSYNGLAMYNTIGDSADRLSINRHPCKKCKPHIYQHTFALNNKISFLLVSDGVTDCINNPNEIAALAQQQNPPLSQAILQNLYPNSRSGDNATCIETEYDVKQLNAAEPRILGVFDGHCGYKVAELLRKTYIFAVKFNMYQLALEKQLQNRTIDTSQYIAATDQLFTYVNAKIAQLTDSNIKEKIIEILKHNLYSMLVKQAEILIAKFNSGQLEENARKTITARVVNIFDYLQNEYSTNSEPSEHHPFNQMLRPALHAIGSFMLQHPDTFPNFKRELDVYQTKSNAKYFVASIGMLVSGAVTALALATLLLAYLAADIFSGGMLSAIGILGAKIFGFAGSITGIPSTLFCHHKVEQHWISPRETVLQEIHANIQANKLELHQQQQLNRAVAAIDVNAGLRQSLLDPSDSKNSSEQVMDSKQLVREVKT